MSFREKIAWASLIAHLAVFGWYFAVFAPTWAARAAADDRGLGEMVLAIVALVMLSIVLAIALALSSRAANITAAVVTAGVLVVMGVLMMGWNSVLAANLLLAVLVAGEVVKATAQIVQFRTSV